jgi:hypothetical protein
VSTQEGAGAMDINNASKVIENYSHLWDGSDPGWELHQITDGPIRVGAVGPVNVARGVMKFIPPEIAVEVMNRMLAAGVPLVRVTSTGLSMGNLKMPK